MSLYDLPKTGIVFVQAKDIIEAGKIVLAATSDDRNCILSVEFAKTFLSEVFEGFCERCEFLEFSETAALSASDVTKTSAKNAIFLDFDIYLEFFGVYNSIRLLNELKNQSRIFVICPTELKNFKKFIPLAQAIFTIEENSGDSLSYNSRTLIYDKKGRTTVQDDLISMIPNSKPIVKKIKNKEEEVDITSDSLQAAFELAVELKESEKNARDALQLPFVMSRQEDGVAIRDAAKKKIRVGGQIIYEPDQADDFDDSDPDDDLNI